MSSNSEQANTDRLYNWITLNKSKLIESDQNSFRDLLKKANGCGPDSGGTCSRADVQLMCAKNFSDQREIQNFFDKYCDGHHKLWGKCGYSLGKNALGDEITCQKISFYLPILLTTKIELAIALPKARCAEHILKTPLWLPPNYKPQPRKLLTDNYALNPKYEREHKGFLDEPPLLKPVMSETEAKAIILGVSDELLPALKTLFTLKRSEDEFSLPLLN